MDLRLTARGLVDFRNASAALVLILSGALLLALYWMSAEGLWVRWTSPANATYSHGPLLLLVAAFLLARRWRAIGPALRPSYVGIALLLSMSIIWFLARLVHVEVIEHAAMILIAWLLFWAMLGFSTAKRLAFPMLLLLTAIPLWEVFSGILQRGTVVCASLLLKVSGATYFRDGFLLSVPAGTFEVSPECSGLRFFIVAVAIALIFAHWTGAGMARGALLLLAAVLVAFISNVIRVFTVVMVGEVIGMNHPLVRDHDWVGWVAFAFGMALYFFLANRYVIPEGPAATEAEGRVEREAGSNRGVALAVVALAVGPGLYQFYSADRSAHHALPVLSLPDRIDHWQSVGQAPSDWRPSFVPADAEAQTLYEDNLGNRMIVHVSYFYREEQGREAVNDLNQVFDRKQWRKVAKQRLALSDSTWGKADVAETHIRSPSGAEKLIWQWYYVGDARTSEPYKAKWMELVGRLQHRQGIAIVALATDVSDSIPKARERLESFVKSGLVPLEQAITL